MGLCLLCWGVQSVPCGRGNPVVGCMEEVETVQVQLNELSEAVTLNELSEAVTLIAPRCILSDDTAERRG